ncbi:MAG: NIPSNAP family protein [Acetobacteraceae bacterium]
MREVDDDSGADACPAGARVYPGRPLGQFAGGGNITAGRRNGMIVDLRIYTVRAGRTAEFVAFYRAEGWPLQQKYLGRCLGWFVSVEGPLNQVVHLWGYESQADREARRTAMAADPAWASYLKKSADLDLLVSQENRFLRPTEFSPVH